jgi:hypothetical protein
MTTSTRRDLLRAGGLLALGSFLGGSTLLTTGCVSTPLRGGQGPAPFAHPEFAGILGVAREDITPPVGIYARNWGAAKHDVAEGIHRPLTATALTLKDAGGGAPLVLVALDLGWWKSGDDEHHVRKALVEALRLDPARVMVNCSHTHAGPATTREDRDKPGGELIAPYLDKVRDAVVRAVRRALETEAPGTLTWATGRCDLAGNRDLPDPSRERWVTGFNPSSHADDAVLVGRVADAAGKTRAVVVNYACHPTTLAWENKLISPDYPGAMRELVEQQAPGALCLYLHGPSGDVGPRQQYTGEVETADRNGRQLGYSVLSTLEGMLPPRSQLEFAGVVESGAPLATWKRKARSPSGTLGARQVDVELPLKDMPTAAEIEAALKVCEDRVMAERLRRKLRVRRTVGEGASAKVPLWVWRVGDGYFVGQPNEAYSQLQTELRRAFPRCAISVMNLVNGGIGYLAPERLQGEDLYQVWQSPFDRGSLERVIASASAALEALGAPR